MERFGDDMKYIQVIRHGLDMAYSRNQGQQYRWAKHFNVPALSASSDEISPNMSLQYWIEANRQTIALASERLGDRFLIIRFDDMVTNPQKTVDELLAFLDIETIDQDLKAKLIAMPRAPRSLWRYKQHDLSIFTAEEIEAVRALGFAVESEQL
ncbi:MAG: hypothetical protein D6737_19945 [Chloroflexi bacterium]|nr:MAG: hypothetical protein D6737_19945 [Chloroflexota bacterium]